MSKVDSKQDFSPNKSLNDWNNLLLSKIEEAKVKFIPKKYFNPNKVKRKFAAPTTLLEAFHFKRLAFKRKKNFDTKENNIEYTHYRNLVNKEVKKSKRAKEQKVAKEAKQNPKVLYQYFASLSKQKETIPNLERPDGNMTENDLEKAQVLSDFFQKCVC